jgi:hypothetical protein
MEAEVVLGRCEEKVRFNCVSNNLENYNIFFTSGIFTGYEGGLEGYVRYRIEKGGSLDEIVGECEDMSLIYNELKNNGDFEKCTLRQRELICRYMRGEIAGGADLDPVLEMCQKRVSVYHELNNGGDLRKCTHEQRRDIYKFVRDMVTAGKDAGEIVNLCNSSIE